VLKIQVYHDQGYNLIIASFKFDATVEYYVDLNFVGAL